MTEKLLVTVVKGVDLESKDSNGLSDPYVILKVGTKKCRTKVVPETLNPEFGETFVLSVNQFEPVRVEVWDHDQLSQDDFEGGFTLNWWTIDELKQKGYVDEMPFKLKSGHGMRKNVDVKGELVLSLRLANFAKELQERGKLTELFPDTPAGEVCLISFDCAIARTSADSAMSGELASGATPRHRDKDDDMSRSVSDRETMPGTVFLLTHFFYAYAVTTREPLKIELSYDAIHTVVRSSYSESGVVLTADRKMKFLIDKLASPETFIQQFTEISAQSLCSPLDALSNAAVNGGDSPVGDVPPTSPRKAGAQPQPRPCEPLLPVTVPFKVYVYEHNTTYKPQKGGEPCPVSLFVGSKPTITFKRVVEDAFSQAGIPNNGSHNSHKSRIFTVLPGVRTHKYIEQKLTSKWTIASCMAPANIVWHGCPVVMRFYNKKTKSGLKIPNPAALVAAAAAATAATLTGNNTGPADVTLSLYVPSRGENIPYPIPQDKLKSLKLPNDELLNTSIPRVLKEAGIEYIPEKHELFIATLGAEPGVDVPLLIPLDLNKKAMELFLVDTDIIVMKELPNFKGIADKFPACDSVDKTALMLACAYASEPLLPQGEKPLDLKALAKSLGLGEDLVNQYTAQGKSNAQYGVVSLLIELQDRLRHIKAHPIYNKDAFESEKSYNDWKSDEQESVLARMRDVLFQRQEHFCTELHVRVVGADDIMSADLGGFSDPYCTVMFKTQMQSTKVCLQTLHPKWDEEFVFSVASLDKAMTFNLYDWDALSAPDYLGTATLPFLEHIGILDGQKHTLTLPINKKGEMTVEVQAFFENSRFLDASTLEPEQTILPETDYVAVYKRLYEVLEEGKNVSAQPPWLLQELSARAGVSQIFCSAMKIDDLLKMEPRVGADFSDCLYNNAMRILRPMSVANRTEANEIVKHISDMYEYIRDKYLPFCFCSKETTRPVMEQCVKLYVECCIGAKKTDEMAKVLVHCVETGVREQCVSLTSDIPWNDAEKVGEEMRVLVCEKLLGFFDVLHGMYDEIMPTNIKPQIFQALVTVFANCIDDCYGQLCNVMCNPEKSYQGAVFAIMKATTTLANNIFERTQLPLEIPSANGLFILWVKNNGPILTEWVERAIKVDKFEPLQPGLLHSSSVVDVSEACSQIITQMKELVIPDVFVWSQAGEVLLAAMMQYFMLQKKRSCEVASRFESTLFEDEAIPLHKICIAIGNIEKGQELLDTIIASVEEGMDTWHKSHTGESNDSRFDISSQALSESVAGTMKAAQTAIADPIRMIATAICSPLAASVNEALASETGLSESAISTYTSGLDDAIGSCHELLSKKSFRMLLYSCWLFSTDTISKALGVDLETNGPKKGMNIPAVRDSIGNAISTLYDYFNPDEGEGLTKAQLDSSRGYNNARRLVCLYTQTTENLIGIVRKFSAKPRELPETTDPLLKDTSQKEIEMLIKTRMAEGDLWARAYAKESGGSDDSQDVRDHFSLPPSELLLNKWVCSVGRKAGTLYLMSRHLCFDTAFSKTMNDETSVVIMLVDILSIEEVSHMLLFKGIKITAEHMDGEEVPVFSKFVAKVQEVMAAIEAQALLIGNEHLEKGAKKGDEKKDDGKGKK